MRVILRGEVVQPGLCCSPSPPVERWKHCDDVGLVDGGVPTIGGSEASIILEPAVWSKVLVVDTVYFDAIRNSIQWTMCCRRNCTQRIMAEETTYQRCRHTQECLLNEDFYPLVMDMQRGIDLAKRILVRQENEDSVDLLHLLHVYILPIIKLCSEDKEHVTQALTNQEQTLQKLNVKIDEMTEQRRMLKQTMRQWREDMCEHLQSETAIVSCNSSFLKLLCEQLKADVEYGYIYIELEMWKKKVQEAKLRVQKKGGRRYVGQLNAAKVGRDAVEERMAKLMYVYKAGLALCASRLSDEQKVSGQHEAYMKIQDEWKGHEKERIELVRRKICALSVREALFHAEEQLTQGKQTTGVEIGPYGIQRPTDVLGKTSLPAEWETLQSQVAKSVELNTVILRLRSEFTDWIHSYIIKELADPQSNPSCSKIKESSSDARQRISSDSRIRQSSREKKLATHFKGLTKTLKHELHHHFNQVVYEVIEDQTALSECSQRVWTCYESCFFSSHYQNILRLYERAYAEVSQELESNLPTFTLQDLSENDKQFLQFMGLYAPDFLSAMLEDPEVTEADTVEVGQRAEVEHEEFEKEDKAEDKDDKTRERLESGISIQGDEQVQVVRRKKDSSKQGSRRKGSHRETQINDWLWLPSPQLEASLLEPAFPWRGSERRHMSLEDIHSHKSARSVRGSAFKARRSLPINIPNPNSKAWILSNPVLCSVSDSGVSSVNVTEDDVEKEDVFESLEDGHSSNSPGDKYVRDNPNSQVFLHRFHTAYNYFYNALKETVPMSKMHSLCKCLQEIATIAGKQSRLLSSGKDVPVLGIDDLLPCLILFLLHGNVERVVSGYHHIKMLDDYMPDFLQLGRFGNVIIQFLVAYSVLLRRECQDDDL